MRRRMHMRRSHVSLGVATGDLSGPREPTPRPDNHITKDACHDFLVLTVRPDDTAISREVQTQTVLTGQDAQYQKVGQANHSAGDADGRSRRPALIYAAVLGSKGEASQAVQVLLAQVNNYHAR